MIIMLILIFVVFILAVSVFYQISWFNTSLIDFCLVTLTFLTYFFYLSKKVPKKVLWTLFAAFILRLGVLILDFYGLANILHSGSDTEAFHQVTLNNLRQGAPVWRITNYTDFLYYIYNITSGRFIAQFFNLIFGFSSIYLLYKSLNLGGVSAKVTQRILLLISFFPNHIILSVVLLREAWIFYFITLSLYMVLKWYFIKPSLKYVIGAFIGVMIASYMHSGVILVLLGYLLLFIFYDPAQDKIVVSLKSILFLGVGIGLIGVLFIFKDSLMGKFASIDIDDLENAQELAMTYTTGESAYLPWVQPENITHLIIFTPLKYLYFLGSPMPLDWHRFKDIIAFVIDGLVYLYLLFCFIKQYRYMIHKTFVKLLFFGVTLSYIAFAWGTWNAGTAMRHRCKLLTVLLVIYGLQTIQKKIQDKKIIK